MENTFRPGSAFGAFLLAFSLLCVSSLTARAQSASPHDDAALRSPEAQSTLSAAVGRDLPNFYMQRRGAMFEAENAAQNLTFGFSPAGIEIRTSEVAWKMSLHSYGRGDQQSPVDSDVPHVKANRVEFQRGPIVEWYVNGPLGLEQGFTIEKRGNDVDTQQETKPLTLALALSGDLSVLLDHDGMGLTLNDASGQAQLRYGQFAATDASGKQLRAWMEIHGDSLLLNVEDADARYPVVIDPFIQRAKLTGSDAIHLDFIGASVAMSGNTVAVGMASTSIPGSVYVFVKPASGWTSMTQVAKLTASDGTPNDYVGYSVAISGDTVVTGAPNAHGLKGAAYVFAKPSSGWTNMTETAELTASGKYQFLGSSVGISGDTVVAGAPNVGASQPGSAYAFVKPASGWINMTQTAKLSPSEIHGTGGFGYCVATSGNTIAVGSQKKVYVFVEPASGWVDTTQTAELFVANGITGYSVAINGTTVVSGFPYATVGSNSEQGAAHVFVEPAGGWKDVSAAAILTASDGAEIDWFGYAVSVSGNVVVASSPFAAIGSNPAQGAAYLFAKPSTGWKTTSHFTAKIVASDGAKDDELGWGVSLSGNTLLLGAPGASSQQGAAYIFGQ